MKKYSVMKIILLFFSLFLFFNNYAQKMEVIKASNIEENEKSLKITTNDSIYRYKLNSLMTINRQYQENAYFANEENGKNVRLIKNDTVILVLKSREQNIFFLNKKLDK